MLLGVHFDVVLRETSRSMRRIERAVPSVENVYLRVAEFGVAEIIRSPILVTNELRPIPCQLVTLADSASLLTL